MLKNLICLQTFNLINKTTLLTTTYKKEKRLTVLILN